MAASSSSSSSILQPEQQQAGLGETPALPTTTTPEAVPTASAWKSSGSIGPFFAVISVLTILAFLSCYLSRIWKRRRPLTPLECIENQGCFGSLNLMCRRCCTHVSVGNNKTNPIHNNDQANKVTDEIVQINQLREIFSRFDMDSDGSLTILELAALLRSLGLNPTGDQIHALLANVDSNRNGSVEFDELVKAILPETNQEMVMNQERMVEAFRCFDRDGNGYISAAELARAMAKLGQPLTYRELMQMIKDADANGDGVISFDEFASVMARARSGKGSL
ncbi:putative calcium-binding protein CML15 [Senna tora]|uniref:Putative calcium-binding protein CML15 n=1 Tax=Senna tora TaxID=362788 RepID=A0A834SRT8_9FABA|nr:putative calcium-binding protein CML15 [Senna tora]